MNTPSNQVTPTGFIHCAGCGKGNPSDRKFCGDCGSKLWETCSQCSTVNAVDEKFCGGCGVNLADAMKQKEDALRDKLDFAVRLEREGRYYEASQTLRSVSAAGDARLASLEANAQQLLTQVDQRRKQRAAESSQLLKQAHATLQRQQYAKAIESLEAIPTGLRTPEANALLEEARTRYEEVKQLTATIRKAIKAKNLEGLLPRVRRLCELQPENKDAQKLADRLTQQREEDTSRRAKKLAVFAQKKFAEGKYQETVDALAQVAEEHRQGNLEQVYRQAKEIVWCAEQLTRATVVTPALLKVAQRWKKMCPADPRAAEVAGQLSQRLKVKTSDRRFLLPRWQDAPPKTQRGYRVEPWSGLGLARVDDKEVAQRLAKYSGRFVTAYGLALQGLGEATLQHDLNPQRKGWGNRLLPRRAKNESIWGLDLGVTSLKAIELTVNKSGDTTCQVKNCVLLPHSTPLHTVDEENRAEVMSQTLEQFTDIAESKRPRVVLGFPGRRGLARFFEMPPARGKKNAEVVAYEMRHQIPVPIEETVFDFHLWETQRRDLEFRPVAAVAARREELEQWVQPIAAAGCEIVAVQCDGFAIYNALQREFLLSQKNSNSAVAVLDVGCAASTLVIGTQNYVWFRSIVHGTQRWNQTLSRELAITHEQSHKVRHDPSTAKWIHQLDELLVPQFDDLDAEVQRSIGAYPRKQDSTVKLMLGSGGGFNQFGLLRHLIHGRSARQEPLRK